MGRPIRNLTGEIFGCYTALRFVETDKRQNARWLCKCNVCGYSRVISRSNLVNSPKDSCMSCSRKTHSKSRTNTQVSWAAMKQR